MDSMLRADQMTSLIAKTPSTSEKTLINKHQFLIKFTNYIESASAVLSYFFH